MKIMPVLALAVCSIGLLCVLPVANAQGSWQLMSTPTPPSNVQQTTGNGTGSVSLTGTVGSNSLSSYTYATQANASGSGNGYQSSSSHQQISNNLVYQWVGMGPPTAYFYLYITPTATAVCTYSDGSNCRWTAIGNAGTSPSSAATANIMQGYGQFPPGPTSNSPGTGKITFYPNAQGIGKLSVTATADASGAILFATGSFTAAATASIKVSEPSPN